MNTDGAKGVHLMSVGRIAVGSLFALSCAAAIADPAGREIMQQQKKRHEVPSEIARLNMHLHDRKGRVRKRAMVTHVKQDAQGNNRILLKFLEPADIRNVGLLTWEQGEGKKDDQWLYLPAAGRVKRIAGATKRSQFMGTDLAYEDLQPENLSRNTYSVKGSETLDGKVCWVVEALPAGKEDRSQTGYGRRVLWIRKDDLVTVKAAFYNHGGTLVKTARFDDVVKIAGTAWRSNRITYEQPLRGSKTVIETTARDLDSAIPDSLLTQQGLKRPPT